MMGRPDGNVARSRQHRAAVFQDAQLLPWQRAARQGADMKSTYLSSQSYGCSITQQ
jgi:ABC-type nitrate/sulfonate/bicarbonate transport system ATPase subunit